MNCASLYPVGKWKEGVGSGLWLLQLRIKYRAIFIMGSRVSCHKIWYGRMLDKYLRQSN